MPDPQRSTSDTASSPICPGCRKPVDPASTRALTETVDPDKARGRKSLAWHQDCFNTFLDAGEET